MLNAGQTASPGTEIPARPAGAGRETDLLLEAFQMFTQASSSLESAFEQLQERARRLSDELEVRNRQLKKSIREKAEVQNYLEKILESLPCGVVVLDNDGGVALCNPVASELLGCVPRRGRRKATARKGSEALRELLSGAAARGGVAGEAEIPYVSGGVSKVLATSGTALRDRSSRSIGSLHIIRDITELKALQEQNTRRDRLTAMGEMAVELAHEIRNPLGSIELFASLLEKELPPGSDAGRWAENIRTGSRSLNNIVSNMLHFANPPSPTLVPVDVHEVLREVLSFTDPITSQRGVTVENSLDAGESRLTGDPELLKQMMLNLILNSLQAMPAHGTLSISTREGPPASPAGCGNTLELCIRDTGVGIAPENLDRVFDPFFTTNKRGTGLGLSVVHRIVERHSGTIRVSSQLGAGTTFTIVLPLDCAGCTAA